MHTRLDVLVSAIKLEGPPKCHRVGLTIAHLPSGRTQPWDAALGVQQLRRQAIDVFSLALLPLNLGRPTGLSKDEMTVPELSEHRLASSNCAALRCSAELQPPVQRAFVSPWRF
mmetsp:Transcript_56242/g.119727  ORF Transcript_56242/g.119727 Transcript_56242/m.119727 type:complete len:114 (+) Transcript_56242:125-466(+)